MQQLMFDQDEETIELKETFSTLQQEVEFKTKKLRKVCKVTIHLHTIWKLIFTTELKEMRLLCDINSLFGVIKSQLQHNEYSILIRHSWQSAVIFLV